MVAAGMLCISLDTSLLQTECAKLMAAVKLDWGKVNLLSKGLSYTSLVICSMLHQLLHLGLKRDLYDVKSVKVNDVRDVVKVQFIEKVICLLLKIFYGHNGKDICIM